jgi:F-box domain
VSPHRVPFVSRRLASIAFIHPRAWVLAFAPIPPRGRPTSAFENLRVPHLRPSAMPLSIINLPLELLFEITRKVSRKDLCQLRSVNSLFDTLATPEIFKSITVRNSNTESTEIFWTILHTPHIARHVQSIKFFEGT